jgi:hypothetical protein
MYATLLSSSRHKDLMVITSMFPSHYIIIFISRCSCHDSYFLSERGGRPTTLLSGTTLARILLLAIMSIFAMSLYSLCIGPLLVLGLTAVNTVGPLVSIPFNQLSDVPTVEYLLPLPVTSIVLASCSAVHGATRARLREFISFRIVLSPLGRDSMGVKDTVLHVWGPLNALNSDTVYQVHVGKLAFLCLFHTY